MLGMHELGWGGRLFLGHHKCATTWVRRILADACASVGRKHVVVADPVLYGRDLRGFARDERADVVSWTNADSRLLPSDDDLRAFHIVRDPRDIVVSAYYSHRYSHPTSNLFVRLPELREELGTLTLDDGLLLEMDELADVFGAMEAWDYEDPRILELHMEDVIVDPVTTLTEALLFLDLVEPWQSRAASRTATRGINAVRRRLGIPPIARVAMDDFARIVEDHDFVKESGGRTPGEEDPTNHFRKGVPGDWRNHFTDRHRDEFLDRYPTLLTTMGYDEDW